MPMPMMVTTWIGLATSIFCLVVGMKRREDHPRTAGVLTTVGIVGIGVNGRTLADHELLRSMFLAVQGMGLIVMFVFLWKYYRRNASKD